MPYIGQDRRAEVDAVVDAMAACKIQADGDLNYILFHFCKNFVKPSYGAYKNFIGELEECATEIRRRLLAPYEDKKIIENGDA